SWTRPASLSTALAGPTGWTTGPRHGDWIRSPLDSFKCPFKTGIGTSSGPAVGHAEKSADTRRRLLDAGIAIFAEKGFRGATIEQISRRAGTNIAAAHYHFGSKEGLYAAVFDQAERQRPPVRSAEHSDVAPPERLHAHVAGFLSRLLDPARPAWM